MSDRGNIVLEICGLEAGYNGRKVLDALDLKLYEGELIGLAGRNGTGKSTLLKTICGLLKPVAGNVIIGGKKLSEIPGRELSKLVSFVSTELPANVDLRVSELVSLGRFPYTGAFGIIPKEDREFVDEIIELTGLENIAGKKLHEISDGERQRALIARALAQDTGIIVMDEPTAFLDVPNRFSSVSLLRRLTRTRGQSIVMSSHDISVMLKTTDILWLITNGAIVHGAPEDLVLEGAMNHLFSSNEFSFSTETGEFIYREKHDYLVGIQGEGMNLEWTVKALARAGVKTVCNNNQTCNVIIEAKPDQTNWIIEKNNHKFVYHSLYELTKEIINHLK
ncbi:MAG: ABC transporter ATP-binding protein [Bacteroidota bacterium]